MQMMHHVTRCSKLLMPLGRKQQKWMDQNIHRLFQAFMTWHCGSNAARSCLPALQLQVSSSQRVFRGMQCHAYCKG